MKRAGALVAVGALMLALCACLPSLASGVRVDVFGDSLTVQAADELTADGVVVHAVGGTAPCDWLSQYAADLAADKPTTVVIAFIGNTGTSCMASVTSPADVVAKYRGALAVMGGQAAIKAKVKVVFVVPPLLSPAQTVEPIPAGPQIGAMECALAATAPDRASCSTSARDLLSPSGVFTGMDAAGDTIRAADGVHLAGPGVDLYAQGLLAGV